MGKFVILKRSNGQYQFRLIAVNGDIILISKDYATKSACENGIHSAKRNSQNDANFIRKTSADGYYYSFALKSENGQIIGRSERYATESGREFGIYSVKKNSTLKID